MGKLDIATQNNVEQANVIRPNYSNLNLPPVLTSGRKSETHPIARKSSQDATAINRVVGEVGAAQSGEVSGESLPEKISDWIGQLRESRTFANLIGMFRPPEATVTRTGSRVIIDAGAGDDQIDVTRDRASGAVTVTVNGERHVFTGRDAENLTIRAGNGNDRIEVGSGVNVNLTLEGGEGNDTIRSGGGNDIIRGGNGDDTISGGNGHDRIEAGAGNDTVSGGAGRDYINGSFGNDRLSGGANDDVIYGGDGDDVVAGQAGNDYLEGGNGIDTISGGNGADKLSGGRGDDSLDGGAGNDTLYAGQGIDRLNGSTGVNRIFAQRGTDEIVRAPRGGSNRVVNVELAGTPGSSVRVEGSPEFVERVEADLEMLRSSPAGRQMLSAYDRAATRGNTVTIVETTEGNAAGYSGDIFRDPANGRAGSGSDGKIYYNTSRVQLMNRAPNDNTIDWTDRPPVVGLFHEMAHAYNYVTGTAQPGDYNGRDTTDTGVNNLERQAVGLPVDHDNNPRTRERTVPGHPRALTENGFRDELNIVRRPHYSA